MSFMLANSLHELQPSDGFFLRVRRLFPRSSFITLDPWGDPLSFSACPLHSFFHLLLISLPSSRLFLILLPSCHPCPRFLRHFTLFFFTFVKSQSFVPCPLLADIACHFVSLSRSLISLPSPSLLFPSATGEST